MEKRNQLLHATWHIGLSLPDGTTLATKARITKNGYEEIEGLPSSADEILACTRECKRVTSMVGRLLQYLRYSAAEIPQRFVREDSRWVFRHPQPTI